MAFDRFVDWIGGVGFGCLLILAVTIAAKEGFGLGLFVSATCLVLMGAAAAFRPRATGERP